MSTRKTLASHTQRYIFIYVARGIWKIANFAESNADSSLFSVDEKVCEGGKVKTAIKISDDENERKSSNESTCCPTCFKMFSLHKIEAHADDCANKWIAPIGDVSGENIVQYL